MLAECTARAATRVLSPILNPRAGTESGPWGHKISNCSIEGIEVGFADFYDRLGGLNAFGYPLTNARYNFAVPGYLHAPALLSGSFASTSRQRCWSITRTIRSNR